jgi:hypothetical protein
MREILVNAAKFCHLAHPNSIPAFGGMRLANNAFMDANEAEAKGIRLLLPKHTPVASPKSYDEDEEGL